VVSDLKVKIGKKPMDLSVSRVRMLTVTVPDNIEELIHCVFDVEAKRNRGVSSHA